MPGRPDHARRARRRPALTRRARELRLDGGRLPARRPGARLALRPRPWPWPWASGRASERARRPRSAGPVQRRQRVLGLGARALGLGRLPAQPRRSRGLASLGPPARLQLLQLRPAPPRPPDPRRASSRRSCAPERRAKLALGRARRPLVRARTRSTAARASARAHPARAGVLPRGDPLLDRGPRSRTSSKRFSTVAALAHLGQLPLGGREPLLVVAEVVGDQPGAELVSLPHQLRGPLGGLGLALQRAKPRPASRSTSSARSRFSRVRSSFSCALWRRLRCLPEPGGLLDQQAAVPRLGVDDRLHPALADHRWASRPMFVSDSASTMSASGSGRRSAGTRRRRSARSGARSRSRRTRWRRGPRVVDHHLDLGEAAGDWPSPGEDHVAHRCPRTATGSARRAPRARRR